MKPVATNIVETDMTVAERLQMKKFRSPAHEAILGILVAASQIRTVFNDKVYLGDITAEQYNILRILRGAHPSGHSCGTIASRMVDNSPDITRRIDALVKKGYATREKSSEDRRVVITKITDKGLDLLAQIDPIVDATESVIMKKLSEKECHDLLALCEKIL